MVEHEIKLAINYTFDEYVLRINEIKENLIECVGIKYKIEIYYLIAIYILLCWRHILFSPARNPLGYIITVVNCQSHFT